MGVDMWAVGVIIGELYNLNPLFAGNTDINQIYSILQVLGTPTPETWPVSETVASTRLCQLSLTPGSGDLDYDNDGGAAVRRVACPFQTTTKSLSHHCNLWI